MSPIGRLYGSVMTARNALYDRGILRSFALGARTISVGNLTTGGTGKTPLVALISELLIESGETVCILTRGYGRANPRERVLVSDGSAILADAPEGGDEPAELAARLGGRAIIVADVDRLSAGQWAKEEFGVTAFVLDDGFQHRRVKRDMDIVCIDATNPCGNGRVLPAGRLRESFTGLQRAGAIVITRSDLVEDTSAIEARLRKWNARAPVFRAETHIARLISLEEFHAEAHRMKRDHSNDDRIGTMVSRRVGAFCAVGNPEAFFRTVERYFEDQSQIVVTKAFADHHSYTQADIDDVESRAKGDGAELLIMTAKDAVKLKGLSFELPCYVAEAEMAIEDEGVFRRLVIGE